VLTENIDQLHALAAALLEHETLSGDEIRDLLAGKPIVREDDTAVRPAPPRKGASVPTTDDKGRDEPGGAAPEPQPGS
jgi:cell division protease FtsH